MKSIFHEPGKTIKIRIKYNLLGNAALNLVEYILIYLDLKKLGWALKRIRIKMNFFWFFNTIYFAKLSMKKIRLCKQKKV